MRRTPGFNPPPEEEDMEARNEPPPAEPEDSPELVQVVKKPRRVNTAINDLIEQRKKAIAVRDKAADEVKQYDAALLALGWLE